MPVIVRVGKRGPAGPPGPPGPAGSSVGLLSFKATVATVGDLPSSGNSVNDARTVTSNGHLYVWNGSTWVDQGSMQGPAGAPGVGVPTGGAAGQVLVKNSATNYDTGWATPAAGGGGGDGTAANTTVTPVGAIAATNVQAALQELDSEKLAVSATSAYVRTNILAAADATALQTALGVDDTTLEERILAILAANDYYPDLVIGDGEALPVTATEGAGLDVVAGTVSGGLSVASVIGEATGAGTTGLTTTATPTALGAGAVCFASISAYSSAATSTAPTPQPNSFTAMGLTWTEIAIPAVTNTNGLNSLKLYKGTGTGTTAKPVVGFPSAVTNCVIRIVHVANASGTVLQATSAAITGSQGTPSVSLPSAPSGNSVTLTVIVQNNQNNTQTPGTGYTEIGSAIGVIGMRVSGAYAIPSRQTASWTTPTTPTAYQKLVAAIEVA